MYARSQDLTWSKTVARGELTVIKHFTLSIVLLVFLFPVVSIDIYAQSTQPKENSEVQTGKSRTYKAPNNIFIPFGKLARIYHWNKKEGVYPCGNSAGGILTFGNQGDPKLIGTWCVGNIQFDRGVKIEENGVRLSKGTIMIYPK